MPPTTSCVSIGTVVCPQYGQLQHAVEGDYRAFRGTPFAAPPWGDLRWRPPAPPAKWPAVRSATTLGNRCPQIDLSGALLGNEDGLTLNSFAVNPPASSKQPVLVDAIRLSSGSVAHRPNVRRHGLDIRWREWRAAERRHRAGRAFRDRHAVPDRPRNRRDTAIAPAPVSARQIRPNLGSAGVGRVAATARSTA